jgi:catechol 2,3-dioxygenase-like lactoylglutathione lyase family enzyme
MKLDSVIFYSQDIEVVIPFYRDVLGLELIEQQGDKFVKFRFENNVELGIKRAVEPREVPGTQTFFAESRDIQTDYDKCKSANARFGKELAHQPWGDEFSILDADGNKVLFIQRNA